jgi:hypothetical protein
VSSSDGWVGGLVYMGGTLYFLAGIVMISPFWGMMG